TPLSSQAGNPHVPVESSQRVGKRHGRLDVPARPATGNHDTAQSAPHRRLKNAAAPWAAVPGVAQDAPTRGASARNAAAPGAAWTLATSGHRLASTGRDRLWSLLSPDLSA